MTLQVTLGKKLPRLRFPAGGDRQQDYDREVRLALAVGVSGRMTRQWETETRRTPARNPRFTMPGTLSFLLTF
jgi:hypothetical protein